MLNWRDLGGLPTASGPIRPGLLFRSGAPRGDVAPPSVIVGSLRTVVDLRSAAERDAAAAAWPGTVRVFAPNAEDGSAVGDPAALAAACGVSGAQTIATVRGLYAMMPAAQARAFAAVYQALAAGGSPLLVHCAVGKDRTGAAIAILLDALGAPRAAIVADYLASNQARAAIAAAFEGDPRTAALRAAPGECWQPLLVADATYLDSLFVAIDAAGGARRYVSDIVGKDGLARIAAHLTG